MASISSLRCAEERTVTINTGAHQQTLSEVGTTAPTVLQGILSMGRTGGSLPWLDQGSANVHVAYLPVHDICSFPGSDRHFVLWNN
jgi:hypothetical protein